MKVLLLANHVNTGGITAYLLNLASSLHKKNGFEYIVASRGGELESEFEKKGVRHIRIPLTTKCEISPKVFFSFLKLRPLIDSLEIDLIHANTRVTQVLAFFLSATTKKPYVSTCHGYFKTRASRRLWPCWGKRVIAISDQVAEHLRYDFGVDSSRIALVYNGIDSEKFVLRSTQEVMDEKNRLGLDPKKKIIGHIGRLSSVKGQKYLILAAEELLKTRDDVQFLIIGSGDEGPALKSLISKKGLGESVILCPSVKDTGLAMAGMDVFAMPSLQEGLGLSILEAQGAGVAVVASRVGGIPTVIEDGKTGLLCPAQDPAALAKAIDRLLSDPDLKAKIVRNAKGRVAQKFSASLMAENTLNVYKDIL